MDKLRLIDAINNSELDYNELYNNINIVDKDKTNFDSETYNEIIYLTMYMYHIKKGINTLGKNGNIPEVIPKYISYGEFKNQLEQYKNVNYHNDLLPNINNVYQELIRLSCSKLLDQGYWTKVYSSAITGNEVKEDGKIYISVDNSYLY